MTSDQTEHQLPLTRDSNISSRVNLPTFGTLLSIISIILLIYVFFSGLSYQFYASFLFLFYAITHSMWISVVFLGIFQTLLMIPFRMIRVIKANSIKEFQRDIAKIKNSKEQSFVLKKKFRQGNVTFLFYVVDFIMQLVSYISIGRLFLTDFYTHAINPKLLYSWVPYPNYPIADTFFKIPYFAVTETANLGWKVLIAVWIVLIIIQTLVFATRRIIRNRQGTETEQKMFAGKWGRYTTGYLASFLILAWFIVRHFPISWQFRIFSGDVSVPNITLNTITAIATFSVLIYHGIPKITRQERMAKQIKLEPKIINELQKQMFQDILFTATIVGLGAFFITNQIPSAFELSIFTLEIISLAAPFTVDKLILKKSPINQKSIEKETVPKIIEENSEEIENEIDLESEINE